MRLGSVVTTDRKAINLNGDYIDTNEKQRAEMKIKNENSRNSNAEVEQFIRVDSPNFQIKTHASDNFFPQSPNKEKNAQEVSGQKSSSHM